LQTGGIGAFLVRESLLHAFIKKSQKTPAADIDLPRLRLAELER